jgi:hypothetical protein
MIPIIFWYLPNEFDGAADTLYVSIYSIKIRLYLKQLTVELIQELIWIMKMSKFIEN